MCWINGSSCFVKIGSGRPRYAPSPASLKRTSSAIFMTENEGLGGASEKAFIVHKETKHCYHDLSSGRRHQALLSDVMSWDFTDGDGDGEDEGRVRPVKSNSPPHVGRAGCFPRWPGSVRACSL